MDTGHMTFKFNIRRS